MHEAGFPGVDPAPVLRKVRAYLARDLEALADALGGEDELDGEVALELGLLISEIDCALVALGEAV